jgi:YidC/Oxa1 family membrane protein insertase
MISSIWHTLVYQPLYNVLVFLIDVLPWGSVGLAIIFLTLFVKAILYPLAGKSIEAQHAMKELEPELKALREKHGDDKQELAKKTMELYQKRGVTPFSGCLPLLIQIPIIFGLYWVFFKGLPTIDVSVLYPFVKAPDALDMHFIGFDLMGKSLVLAFLAGLSQYFQADLSLKHQPKPAPVVKKDKQTPSFQDDFARTMQIQMRYVLPVMVGLISVTLPAAVALYWTTSNILGIGQELLMHRKRVALRKGK